MSDPKRLLDGLDGGELKGLLEAGKSELPNDAQMLALAAKIGIAGALGGAGGAGAAGASGAGGAGAAKAGATATAVVKGATAIKIGVAVAVVSAAGAGTVAVTTAKKNVVADEKPSGIVAAPSVTSTTGAATASESLPPRVDPFASANVDPSAKPTTTASAMTKSAAPNAAEEVKMLERAQDALRSARHADALSLCNEHATRYPNGMLAQEREVIAVEALVKTGRTAEAKARAEKFKARFPGSSHTRRIDTLLER